MSEPAPSASRPTPAHGKDLPAHNWIADVALVLVSAVLTAVLLRSGATALVQRLGVLLSVIIAAAATTMAVLSRRAGRPIQSRAQYFFAAGALGAAASDMIDGRWAMVVAALSMLALVACIALLAYARQCDEALSPQSSREYAPRSRGSDEASR